MNVWEDALHTIKIAEQEYYSASIKIDKHFWCDGDYIHGML